MWYNMWYIKNIIRIYTPHLYVVHMSNISYTLRLLDGTLYELPDLSEKNDEEIRELLLTILAPLKYRGHRFHFTVDHESLMCMAWQDAPCSKWLDEHTVCFKTTPELVDAIDLLESTFNTCDTCDTRDTCDKWSIRFVEEVPTHLVDTLLQNLGILYTRMGSVLRLKTATQAYYFEKIAHHVGKFTRHLEISDCLTDKSVRIISTHFKEIQELSLVTELFEKYQPDWGLQLREKIRTLASIHLQVPVPGVQDDNQDRVLKNALENTGLHEWIKHGWSATVESTKLVNEWNFQGIIYTKRVLKILLRRDYFEKWGEYLGEEEL